MLEEEEAAEKEVLRHLQPSPVFGQKRLHYHHLGLLHVLQLPWLCQRCGRRCCDIHRSLRQQGRCYLPLLTTAGQPRLPGCLRGVLWRWLGPLHQAVPPFHAPALALALAAGAAHAPAIPESAVAAVAAAEAAEPTLTAEYPACGAAGRY
jgi:hypothetical protein